MASTPPRITVRPDVCAGKPCIRDLRFPVSRLLGMLAAGETRDSVLAAYPYLEADDIAEALRYAASLADDDTGAERLVAASKKARKESMKINAEFAAVERDADS